MADEKTKSQELRDRLKKGMEMLEDMDIDEISDDDLEAVAGGATDEGCSNWCCSDNATLERPADA